MEDLIGSLKERGSMTSGIENAFAQLIDNHESAVYLLSQRMKG